MVATSKLLRTFFYLVQSSFSPMGDSICVFHTTGVSAEGLHVLRDGT